MNPQGQGVEAGELADDNLPGLADLVHTVGTISVTIKRDDGSSTIYTRSENGYGHCDTCGAPCTDDGCVVDVDHLVSIDGGGDIVNPGPSDGMTEVERDSIRDAGRPGQ